MSEPASKPQKQFRLLITGSREWSDVARIREAMESALDGLADDEIVIVHGDCPTGADALARRQAESWGLTQDMHPADWSKHGRRAGFVRNAEMAALGADLCLAFPKGESRGTRMMMDIAEKAGIKVVSHEG